MEFKSEIDQWPGLLLRDFRAKGDTMARFSRIDNRNLVDFLMIHDVFNFKSEVNFIKPEIYSICVHILIVNRKQTDESSKPTDTILHVFIDDGAAYIHNQETYERDVKPYAPQNAPWTTDSAIRIVPDKSLNGSDLYYVAWKNAIRNFIRKTCDIDVSE